MDIKHRTQLPELMCELGLPMIAVEIGVAEARFSLELLQAGIETLLLVDNWGEIEGQKGDGSFEQSWHDANYRDMLERLKDYPQEVLILKGLSVEMASKIGSESLSLVYIDADHSYEGVKRDIEAWYPKLISGGIMAFHDYENTWDYGVKKAVHEFCDNNNLLPILIPENNLVDAGAYFIKP